MTLISRQDFSADLHRCVSISDNMDSGLLTHSVDFKVDEVGKLFAHVAEKRSYGRWVDNILIKEEDILYVADRKSINYKVDPPFTGEPIQGHTRKKIIQQLNNRTLLVSHIKLNWLPDRSYILISPA